MSVHPSVHHPHTLSEQAGLVARAAEVEEVSDGARAEAAGREAALRARAVAAEERAVTLAAQVRELEGYRIARRRGDDRLHQQLDRVEHIAHAAVAVAAAAAGASQSIGTDTAPDQPSFPPPPPPPRKGRARAV